MRVLGLESSCDETACAIVEVDDRGGLTVKADVVASQIALHARFGGIVPEVAARHHIQNILPTLEQALGEAGLGLADIDAVAVTRGPGLVGALLVAVQVGKTIAFARGLPLVGVNHLEGHLLAAYLAPPVPPLPHLGLLVSGGHTSLVHVHGFGRYEVLGTTCDDAAGEAFDKVGKLLGLGYPAGPVIDRLAEKGDAQSVRFPRAMTGKRRGLHMSFSGLKTAASEALQKKGAGQGAPLDGAALADFCASFQAAVVEQLVRKTSLALDERRLPAVVLSGGVASNRGLRAAMAALCAERGIGFFVAPPRFCTDNGAMIAAAGALRLLRGERDGLDLNAVASLPL